jgi:GNAT superfamily N-acetyltransferase
MRRTGQAEVDEPGVAGLLPCKEAPFLRLLVTDDRAHELLASLLRDAGAGTVQVLAEAPRCLEVMNEHPAWTRSETATAMVCPDLRTVPVVALPRGLTLREVRRLPADAADGVPLEQAVALAMRADPRIAGPPAAFADYLRSLPRTAHLFAAVDAGGAVRATSGCNVVGPTTSVFFVNTDPEWRGQGIGYAMTSQALGAARDRGARQASLDATGAGQRIYERLGFEAVTQATRFTVASP